MEKRYNFLTLISNYLPKSLVSQNIIWADLQCITVGLAEFCVCTPKSKCGYTWHTSPFFDVQRYFLPKWANMYGKHASQMLGALSASRIQIFVGEAFCGSVSSTLACQPLVQGMCAPLSQKPGSMPGTVCHDYCVHTRACFSTVDQISGIFMTFRNVAEMVAYILHARATKLQP